MYHPIIQKLDSIATAIYPSFPDQSKYLSLLTGNIHQEIVRSSPFKTNRRFFNAQWVWALGHIGILYQTIRWLKKHDPSIQLILETRNNVANPYFLNALSHLIDIYSILPAELEEESKYNSVYFACPDGKHHVHDFMKVAEAECKDINLLSPIEKEDVNSLLDKLGIQRPYVAVQARHIQYDAKRNVTLEQVEEAIAWSQHKGYSIVSTGLDDHPINSKIKSVRSLDNPMLASFLLSADCDHFIGSDSGAWVIPWAYGRPVELINDKTAAWIYP